MDEPINVYRIIFNAQPEEENDYMDIRADDININPDGTLVLNMNSTDKEDILFYVAAFGPGTWRRVYRPASVVYVITEDDL